MDEYHRRFGSGRYDHDKGKPKKKPDAITRLREYLVPGSGKGVTKSQNKRETDQLKEEEDRD